VTRQEDFVTRAGQGTKKMSLASDKFNTKGSQGGAGGSPTATSSGGRTSFGDDHDLIDGGSWDLLFFAVGPNDVQLFDFGGGAKAEVEAGVGAGCVAAAGEDIGALAHAVDGEEDFGAHGVAGRVIGGG
jgi:hypothetical protein